MAKIIPITQNPQRYTQQTNSWVISASPNISPITIEKGISIGNLKPVLEVDGIIVKVDDWYLCSQNTIDALQTSNNPHYAIESNGPIKVKDKEVMMGKSIKIIEIDVDKLKKEAEGLDFQNRKAAVSYVDYIFEGDTQDGVPVNLIRQINYTLNPTIDRPVDKYGLHSFQLGDDDTIYSIDKLNTQTKQSDGSLDKAKLETFLQNLQNRLIILRSDFNMIKDVFYNGTFPDSQVTIDFEKVATPGLSDTAKEEPPVLFKYTQLAQVVETPLTSTGSASGTTTESGGTTTEPTPLQPGQPATNPTPPIIQLKMRKKRDLRANKIPVYENDPTVGDKGGRKRLIKEGDTFWGYFFKDWEHGQKVWVVYESDKTTIVGWGVADRNDFVDPV